MHMLGFNVVKGFFLQIEDLIFSRLKAESNLLKCMPILFLFQFFGYLMYLKWVTVISEPVLILITSTPHHDQDCFHSLLFLFINSSFLRQQAGGINKIPCSGLNWLLVL